MRAACSAVTMPLAMALAFSCSVVDAGAVVGDLDVDLAALVEGAQRTDGPPARLAGGQAGLRQLDAVVDGIADDVGERVLDGLDDGLVQLRLCAFHLDVDLFAAGQPARSRTTRGSLFQTLPMGCMRVFMTPS